MTSDGTLYSRDERASELDSNINDSDWNVAEVQLTVAGAARVTLPQGQQVVVVPVTPGERVELPTDSADGLLAELGPQGNLAIVVDGRTIILQGYVAANEESPVSVVTSDGDQVDVAFVLAETDPSLDIQTAAGPAAGSAGGGADGGSGIFVPLPAGPLLGGFDAEGVLGATALQYKLVDNSAKIFDLDDDDEIDGGIENSLPDANPDSATVAQSVATNYQLMLVIDVSGSMREEVVRPDGAVTTRMELQKAAVIAMLESYAMATTGSVNIKMVQFSNGAAYFGGTDASTFLDIKDPANLEAVILAINALGPTFNTDYDTALATAQQGIMDASWVTTTPTTKGLVYFFSDGVPVDDGDSKSSYPGGGNANGINNTEENIWEGRPPAVPAPGFPTGLASKGVVSIAVGLGADVALDAAALTQLGRVAYYNESFRDDSVIVVSDENQLIAEIIQTVPATVTGNVLTNDDPGKDGFGSPTITAISAVIDPDTTSQIVTATATGYKVETNNGMLVIDTTTGEFIYTAAPGGSGNTDTFTYTIQDAFLGDTDSATLTIEIVPPILKAPFDGTDGNNFIIGDDADNTINAAGGIDSVQGGFGNDVVDGGTGNDALYGQEGQDTLLGGDGDDALFGGNFADTLIGGAGIDGLAGGAGDDLLDGGDGTETDILSGGVGEDTLTWRGADDVYGGGADLFNASNVGKAGDVLDASGATSIDFTTIDDGKIEDVETIRLTGGAGTTITIDANDVITDFEAGALDPGGAGPGGNYDLGPILRVDGDDGDTLNLTGGDWSKATGSGGTPLGYTLYVHESGGGLPGAAEDAYVLVQDTVSVATV